MVLVSYTPLLLVECEGVAHTEADLSTNRPGAASIGLLAGQIVGGVGTAVGHSAVVNRVLAKANVEVFVPAGLEIW
jgi:hypothetical protein